MKKTILLIMLAFIGLSNLNAQVGIGTENPKGALDVDSDDAGIVVPRVANTAAVTNPVNGMIIYDLSSNCFRLYQNDVFTDCMPTTRSKSKSATVQNDCDTNGFEGTYEFANDTSDRSFSVTITNDSFSSADISFSSSDLSLSGVGGLTVGTPTANPSLSSGSITLNSGDDVIVTYPITGTFGSSGTLIGDWKKLGLTCTKEVIVEPDATITSLDNCDNPNITGSLTEGEDASGVSADINYSGGNGGEYSDQSIASTGVTGLTASLPAGSVANGNGGTLTYTISGTPSTDGVANFAISIGGESCTFSINVATNDPIIASLDNCNNPNVSGSFKEGFDVFVFNLDFSDQNNDVTVGINYSGGNGNDYAAQSVSSTGVSGLTASLSAGTLNDGSGTFNYIITGTPDTGGTADFAISIGGQSCTFSVSVEGIQTIQAAGKTWIDRNLGATKAADSIFDEPAWGDLYQWGRFSDGHEDRDSNVANGDIASNRPDDATDSGVWDGQFIERTVEDFNWLTNTGQNNNLWDGVNGINNPCPDGFRVPTETEFNNFISSLSSNTPQEAFNTLKLTKGGYRQKTGSLKTFFFGNPPDDGRYWTSTTNSDRSRALRITNSLGVSNDLRVRGYSVRCLKD